MYKVDVIGKKLKKLEVINFGDLEVEERFDIEVWVRENPEILGEPLLIVSEQTLLPSGRQPDLLALDKDGNMVVIELKKDDSGREVYWQGITYTAQISEFSYTDIIDMYEKYLENIGITDPNPKDNIEDFIEEDIEKTNQKQKLILVSKEFHPDVLRAVLWLRDFEVDIKCIKLTPYKDENDQVFLNTEIIIPTPGVEDYIEKRISKQKNVKKAYPSPFSLERGSFKEDELKIKLINTLTRVSDLTPRLIAFIEILSSEERTFDREEIKQRFHNMGIGKNIGQSGRYLSNISQFLTKKSTPHLRQVIEFQFPKGIEGEVKDNYRIFPEYIEFVKEILKDVVEGNTAGD